MPAPSLRLDSFFVGTTTRGEDFGLKTGSVACRASQHSLVGLYSPCPSSDFLLPHHQSLPISHTFVYQHARYHKHTVGYSRHSTMAFSKFTEVLDCNYQSTSPQSDVRLEDLIPAPDLSGRGRTSSGASYRSESSYESRQNSGERTEEKTKRRVSRLLSLTKR